MNPEEIHPSSIARYSAALMVGLVLYASLYPFIGWRDQGLSPFAFVLAPWPRFWTSFDLVLNVLGYIPLGALLIAVNWPRWHGPRALILAVLFASALSFCMESLQSYLPDRIASNIDWGLNTIGATLGAMLALLILPRLPATNALYALRQQWFTRDASFGLWLMALWPLALLTPQSLLFGTGSALSSAAAAMAELLTGSPAFEPLAKWFAGWEPTGLSEARQQVVPFVATLAVSLSFASLMTPHVSYRRRALLTLGLIALGCAATTLCYAMSYGPSHAHEWLTKHNLYPLSLGVFASLALIRLPRRWCAALAVVFVLLQVSMVNQYREDWYFMLNMQSWQQGRWIRLHGLAQWMTMLWPWVLIPYLLKRLVDGEAVKSLS